MKQDFNKFIKTAGRLLPDSLYLRIQYYYHFHKKLNLRNPKTFNEKLEWLKLYYRRDDMPLMVDKYRVKEYVANSIGSEYVVPLLAVWDNPAEIDFDILPQKFVLKCNHDSGGLVICKDKGKLDFEKARRILTEAYANNNYWHSREWPYKNLEKKVIAEQFLENPECGELLDYKFFCFNGRVKCFKIDFGRFVEHHANYFDPKGHLLPFGEVICPPVYDHELILPSCLEEMISLSEKLAVGFPFVRVDFYCVKDHIYFGEITFFPAACVGRFVPDEWDGKLGEWLQLPKKKVTR